MPKRPSIAMQRTLRYAITLGLGLCLAVCGWAHQGMWLPSLVKQLNIKDMQAKGLKLTAEDLYSVNQASLKDAVAQLGNGCTGAMVSPTGLLLTNHHCAYSYIQALSSVAHDYLTDGYCAKSLEEELPCQGLTVRFLEYMDDVTDSVLRGGEAAMDESARAALIESNTRRLVTGLEAKNPKLKYDVEPLFYGNQYFLFAYREFTDIRLVVAPPSAIGKFGGDTDNWVWPRHTGDFSLLRVYADSSNQPADYSPANVPYRPRKSFKISTKGVKPGEFAMVYGYPGRTQQFLVSQAVAEVVNHTDPRNIGLRDQRLAVMRGYMQGNDTIRIKYASKYADVANAWKKWQGEVDGLTRNHAVEVKENLERSFGEWVKADPQRVKTYGYLLDSMASIYSELEPLNLISSYLNQGLRGIESLDFAMSTLASVPGVAERPTPEELATFQEEANGFYKDYDPRVDRELMVQMLKAYRSLIPKGSKAEIRTLDSLLSSSTVESLVGRLFSTSIFTDAARCSHWLAEAQAGRVAPLADDPLLGVARALRAEYTESIYPHYRALQERLVPLYRLWLRGLQAMNPKALYAPDANFTLRLAYGKVEGYKPREAVVYTPTTTLDGVVEKEAMGAYDYVVPVRLRELWEKKDFGRWGENGSVPACFLASIHTTGGNSGSPTLNARGELIGLNFDRVWEGTMSDIMFDPHRCRNIVVDIRYVLFLIDKYARAGYLVDEMGAK